MAAPAGCIFDDFRPSNINDVAAACDLKATGR
jgi:hypothetical protein